MDVAQSNFPGRGGPYPFDELRAPSLSRGFALRRQWSRGALAPVIDRPEGGPAPGRSKSAPLPLIGAVVVALCLLLSPLPAQEKPADPVIYPRGSAPAEKSSSSASSGSSLNSFFLLGAAAVAAGAGWWLWQKRRTGIVNGQAAKLAIVESRSLGSRQYLVVADYDGRKFLLSVCPGSIDLLTPLDGNPPPPK